MKARVFTLQLGSGRTCPFLPPPSGGRSRRSQRRGATLQGVGRGLAELATDTQLNGVGDRL